mmetsp:Transcript_8065/g.9371  ORF Transcript_8065/g.9371 Transcript_8065/m.9371 type:complete len:372 (-) Transcript_8065:287-1402(-)
MATHFDRTKALAGLPPVHAMTNYQPQLATLLELEQALSTIKITFEDHLKQNLNLVRVSAPLFVSKTSGFNDNLNGVERPATFAPRDFEEVKLEVPFSLAKWKRWALHYYQVPAGQGVVTDFRGLRCDDDVDFTHSLYVDQFDWEKRITEEDRNIEYLKDTVRAIYRAVYDTEQAVSKKFGIAPVLPKDITFLSSCAGLKEYPDKTAKEREDIYCEKYKAVFYMGIGGWIGTRAEGNLRHDGRAPDYDDWITPRGNGCGTGLNGDILVWNPILKQAFELSSMGIRVNPTIMEQQLELCGDNDRKSLMWHQLLLNGTLPANCIGGGIGQSRLCQFMLRCAHIGEVQHGWYNPAEVKILQENNIQLLGSIGEES